MNQTILIIYVNQNNVMAGRKNRLSTAFSIDGLIAFLECHRRPVFPNRTMDFQHEKKRSVHWDAWALCTIFDLIG